VFRFAVTHVFGLFCNASAKYAHSEYPLLAVGGTSHSTCCSSTVAHLFSRKLVAVTACTPSPYWVIDHATRVILRTRPRLPFSDSSQTNS
jgi:hypothetical protein